MPGNRLPFTIRVCCQIDRIGILSSPAQLGQDFALPTNRYISRLEIVLHVDTQLFGRQVAHVSHARFHYEVAAQYLVDRFSLGR